LIATIRIEGCGPGINHIGVGPGSRDSWRGQSPKTFAAATDVRADQAFQEKAVAVVEDVLKEAEPGLTGKGWGGGGRRSGPRS